MTTDASRAALIDVLERVATYEPDPKEPKPRRFSRDALDRETRAAYDEYVREWGVRMRHAKQTIEDYWS